MRTQARSTLIERYLPLARALALRYRGSPEEIDDLVQVASLGLVKAVDRWDPDRGVAFTTFAVPTILGELRHHLRDRTGASGRRAAFKISRPPTTTGQPHEPDSAARHPARPFQPTGIIRGK